MTDLPYRLGVGIMVLNESNHVFVAKRIDTILEAWQMPQGGIDVGEDPWDAARRELEEETSMTRTKKIAVSRDWHYYDLPDDIRPNIWKGKYKGQKQLWYLLRFLGTDEQINIHTNEPEFKEYKWIPMQKLPDLIVPFKRELYQNLVDEFQGYIQ